MVGLAKRRLGCTGVFLFVGLSGAALLRQDALGTRIGEPGSVFDGGLRAGRQQAGHGGGREGRILD